MPTTGKKRISLYFHIPFCSKKCPYCHFFVLPNKEELKKPYLDALLTEWRLRVDQLKGVEVVSIYFGGGTPTKLEPAAYKTLLEEIYRSNISIASDCEITLEGNPEDITYFLMQQFREVGINRLSLGVQSLVDEDLHVLGRTHNAMRSNAAIFQAYEAGITNISIDLMFELPEQGIERWQRSLKALSNLPITHLSLYNLTIEPHTAFFKQRKKLQQQLKSEEEHLQMLETALVAFEELGLRRYEISAFAKPGYTSRHNTGYWTGRPFLGLGPSAFSYWEGSRFSNVAHFQQYLQRLEENQLPVGFQETLPFPNNVKELVAIALRLVEGISVADLPEEVHKTLLQLQEEQFVCWEGERVGLTSKGQLFYDSVAAEIIG